MKLTTTMIRNMNLMWSEMTDLAREEYKAFFLAYHDAVARSGFTGRRVKPLSALPPSLLRGFETAVLAKVKRVMIEGTLINMSSN